MIAENRHTILAVDDDPVVIKLLKRILIQEQFEVLAVQTANQALDILTRPNNTNEFDLAIIDLMLPEIDGLELCRRIRLISQIPIIILSAKDTDVDKIVGLSIGADDYLTKPFNPQELVARIRALLRRTHRYETASADLSLLTYNGIEINRELYQVKLNGEPIELSPRLYNLLCYFMQNVGRTLTRQGIFEALWSVEQKTLSTIKGENTISPRTIDVHIRHLRELIELNPAKPIYIKTIWGVGYKFGVETA